MNDYNPLPIRCTATNRAGRQCGRRPVPGANVCSMHGGKSPGVMRRARERVIEARINGELHQQGWEPVNDPVAWYTDVAGEVRAFLALCRDALGQLNTLDQRTREGEDVRALVSLYERALDRAQRTADNMTSRGIEGRALANAQRDAAEVIEFCREAVALARREPDMAADQIILRLIGSES